MFKLKATVLVSTLAILAGCATHQPDHSYLDTMPVPSSWSESGVNADGGSGSIFAWQDFVQDPTLKQLIEFSIEHNRDMRVASLNVQRMRDLYRIERSNLLPSVEMGGGQDWQRTLGDGPNTTSRGYSANLGATNFEIDFFGRVQALSDVALSNYLATEQAQQTLLISLIGQVSQAYLSLLSNQDLLGLAQKTHEAQLESLRMVEQSAKMGAATSLDVQQARIPTQEAKVDIARFETLVRQDLNALQLLVGKEVSLSDLPGGQDSKKMFALAKAPLDSTVLLRRPDVRAAEHRLLSAQANVHAARAALFPRITLTTSVGTASAELDGLFDQGVWRIAPRIDLPIFDAGQRRARVRVSQTDQEIAQAEYEKVIQIAFKEVADELARKATLNAQIEAQTTLERAAERYHDLSVARYKEGMDSYYEVLDAQRSLYRAQQGTIELERIALLNQIKLYTSLGTITR